MFKMFSNHWTPVLPVSEIGDKPVAVELAGEKLVLFRSSPTQISALADYCPHRGAALSLGEITANGCIECPYHGWQFDGDGNCVKVPLNNLNDLQLSKLGSVSLPTRVLAGLVWIFTGSGDSKEQEIPESLLQRQESYIIYHEVWNAHWTRAIENSMDYVHVPFVHKNSFGANSKKVLGTEGIAESNIEITPFGAKVFNRYNNIPSGFAFDWYKPNLVVLKFDEFGMPLRSHLFAVPINQQQTRIILAILWLGDRNTDKSQSGSFNPAMFIDPIMEDRVIIESQPGAIPQVNQECNVPSDKQTLIFRRWYHQEIATLIK